MRLDGNSATIDTIDKRRIGDKQNLRGIVETPLATGKNKPFLHVKRSLPFHNATIGG